LVFKKIQRKQTAAFSCDLPANVPREDDQRRLFNVVVLVPFQEKAWNRAKSQETQSENQEGTWFWIRSSAFLVCKTNQSLVKKKLSSGLRKYL